MKNKMLHCISVFGSFLITFGSISWLQYLVFSVILKLKIKDIQIGVFKLDFIIYSLISILLIIKYFSFSSKYKKESY